MAHRATATDARPESGRFVPALGHRALTPLYDAVIRLTTREPLSKRMLLRQAGFRGGMDVLDVACGTGTLAIWGSRAAPGTHWVGIDGDPEMLERARAKAAREGVEIRFDEGMSYDLPYPDDSFDRVLSTLFFHHLVRQDKQRTIAEVLRVLRPGGQLHVADFGRPASSLHRGLFYAIRLTDGLEQTADNVGGRLPSLFEGGGFTGVRTADEITTAFVTLAFYSAAKPG